MALLSQVLCSACVCAHRHLARVRYAPGDVRCLEWASTLSSSFYLAFYFSLPPSPRGGQSLSSFLPLTAAAVVCIELLAISRDLGAPSPPAPAGAGAAPPKRREASRSLLDLRAGDCWRWDDTPSYALAAGVAFLALCLFCSWFSPRPPLSLLRALRGCALLGDVLRAALRARGGGAPAGGALLGPIASLACAAAAWALLRGSTALPVEAAYGSLAALLAEATVLVSSLRAANGKRAA